MGCNAHNHASDCDCGWGGVNYGGGGRSGGPRFAAGTLRLANPDVWRARNATTYEAFTVPNANCPRCGRRVFFYQSPYGGRVFFDSLGPPWPKHPCTDRARISFARQGSPEAIFAPPVPAQPRPVPKYRPDQWRPLDFVSLSKVAGFDRAELRAYVGCPVRYLYVPGGRLNIRPCFWKPTGKPNEFEVSSVLVEVGGTHKEEIVQVRGCDSDEEFIRRRGSDAAEAANRQGVVTRPD